MWTKERKKEREWALILFKIRLNAFGVWSVSINIYGSSKACPKVLVVSNLNLFQIMCSSNMDENETTWGIGLWKKMSLHRKCWWGVLEREKKDGDSHNLIGQQFFLGSPWLPRIISSRLNWTKGKRWQVTI